MSCLRSSDKARVNIKVTAYRGSFVYLSFFLFITLLKWCAAMSYSPIWKNAQGSLDKEKLREIILGHEYMEKPKGHWRKGSPEPSLWTSLLPAAFNAARAVSSQIPRICTDRNTSQSGAGLSTNELVE